MSNGTIRVEYQDYYCEIGISGISIEDAKKIARDHINIPDGVIPRIGLRVVYSSRILKDGETVLFVDRSKSIALLA